jgi:hypothetical protein
MSARIQKMLIFGVAANTLKVALQALNGELGTVAEGFVQLGKSIPVFGTGYEFGEGLVKLAKSIAGPLPNNLSPEEAAQRLAQMNEAAGGKGTVADIAATARRRAEEMNAPAVAEARAAAEKRQADLDAIDKAQGATNTAAVGNEAAKYNDARNAVEAFYEAQIRGIEARHKAATASRAEAAALAEVIALQERAAAAGETPEQTLTRRLGAAKVEPAKIAAAVASQRTIEAADAAKAKVKEAAEWLREQRDKAQLPEDKLREYGAKVEAARAAGTLTETETIRLYALRRSQLIHDEKRPESPTMGGYGISGIIGQLFGGSSDAAKTAKATAETAKAAKATADALARMENNGLSFA